MLPRTLQRQESSPTSSGSFPIHSIAHKRVLFQRDPVSGSNYALGGKDASRWTPSDPFRPDKFGNRIAICVSVFDQIIHVSHSRAESVSQSLWLLLGLSPKILVKTETLDGLPRRFPPSASTLC